VLLVLAQKIERRTKALERVRLRKYDRTVHELRQFVAVVKRAQEDSGGGRWDDIE
jgi:hypothetical protein